MDILTGPGDVIYGLVIVAAFIGALAVSFMTIMSLAWGGSASFMFNLVVVTGNLCTLGLFTGLLGVLSRRPIFAFLTLLGSSFFPCVFIALFLPILWHQNEKFEGNVPLSWVVLFIVDSFAVVLSIAKLKQLRTTEVTPWPQ